MNDPHGRNSVAPRIDNAFIYLHVGGGAEAIRFYADVFGARERFRLDYPDGRVAHAELELGPIVMMLADEDPEYGIRGPRSIGGTGSTIHLHVDDVDRLTDRAAAAGAEVVRAPEDQPHGERQARIRDPFGHEWLLGHTVEPLSPDEMRKRFNAAFADNADG